MIVARKKEKETLLDSLRADEAQFVAVYGRRRVGKTFLIRETFGDNIVFSHAGSYHGTYSDQLEAFAISLEEYALKWSMSPRTGCAPFSFLRG